MAFAGLRLMMRKPTATGLRFMSGYIGRETAPQTALAERGVFCVMAPPPELKVSRLAPEKPGGVRG